MRRLFFLSLCCFSVAAALVPGSHVVDLQGTPIDPLVPAERVRVLLFVRTDCPITNRYAPELQRLAASYRDRPVDFWLIYPDRSEQTSKIRQQLAEYVFPGKPVLDPAHELVRRARATVAPEAAVFDRTGREIYHGRIDNRWVDVGKSRPVATVHDLQDAIGAALGGKPLANATATAIGCSLADVQ